MNIGRMFELGPDNGRKLNPLDCFLNGPDDLDLFPPFHLPYIQDLMAPIPITPSSSADFEPLDDKRFACPHPDCPKVFSRLHNLKSHYLIHTNDRPYVCKTCNMAFRRNHDLRRHERLHTGLKPFACHQCGKRFSRSDALKRHQKVEMLNQQKSVEDMMMNLPPNFD